MRLVQVASMALAASAFAGGAATDLPPHYPPGSPITVKTPLGPVTGTRYEGGWDGYLGIKYASNPRFEPPVPVQPWTTPLNATKWGPACPQQLKCADEPHVCPHAIDEAGCLTVNVFTPSAALAEGASLRPVLVFIVGGNFDVETANLLLYDGRHLAVDEDVVSIGINYRLGAIGALRLDPGTPDGIEGGFGIMDQQAALRWVRDNVAAFGGDPNRVTIHGQSAGASSVLVHLALPSSKGLFQRAISQSNPASIFYKDASQSEADAARLAANLSCTGEGRAACMRAKPWVEIAQAQGHFKSKTESFIDSVYDWGPAIGDASGLTSQPIADAIAGTLANSDVPVILGVTHDEAEQWIYQPFPAPVPPLGFDALLFGIFGGDGIAVGEQYPLPQPFNASADTRPTAATIGTHYTFVCSNRASATGMVAGGQGGAGAGGPNASRVYLYHYDHIFSDPLIWGANFSYCADRACHGAELPLLFGTADLFYPTTAQEEALGRAMRAYWAAFARGDTDAGGAIAPTSVPGLPAWPLFTKGSAGEWMRFETAAKGGPRPAAGWLGDKCDFWDTLGYGHF